MRAGKLAMIGFAVSVTGLMTYPAWAQNQDAYVVTRPDPGIHATMPASELSTSVQMPVYDQVSVPDQQVVLSRPVVESAATVGRALAEQPVFPYLVKLKVGLATVYLDPSVDYQHTEVGGLDENNMLVRALRLPRHYQQATSPYIVNRSGPRALQKQAAIAPQAVILVPSSDSPIPQPHNLMPAVPRTRNHPGPQMARADN